MKFRDILEQADSTANALANIKKARQSPDFKDNIHLKDYEKVLRGQKKSYVVWIHPIRQKISSVR